MKGTGPSRQLFETVNFAFMKIFHFLVKIVIFRAILIMHIYPDQVFFSISDLSYGTNQDFMPFIQAQFFVARYPQKLHSDPY